jgi:hypothetical protein
MIKAGARLKDGRMFLTFGLSDSNCAKLLQDKPIVFDGAGVRCPEWCFCISCRQPDGRVALPRQPPKPLVLVLIDAKNLEGTADGLCLLSESDGEPCAKILVFRGKDEQSMHAELRQFINERTDVTVSGFPPGTFRVSDN